MKLRDGLHASLWLLLYLFFVLAPLFALLLGTHPPARDFWTEFSVALGYAALAMMGLQFALTARFRFITKPFGEDVIYHFHRRISILAVSFALAHPVILFIARPELLPLLNSFQAPWRARFAALSLYTLIAIIVMALWRAKWNIRYETWHISHIVLAVIAIAAALAHMVGWGYYLASPWKQELWIALPLLWIALLLYVRLIKPLFILRRPYRVAEIRAERDDARTLVMRPDGHAGFRFRPGQFGWLTIWGSPFKITGHPFSFSSSAEAADGRVEMTIKNLGDFTSTIATVTPGQRVWLDGPYGAFTIGNPADMHVLIAGGVGITPMMSMLRTLADRGDKRPTILIYGGRNLDALIFHDEIEAIKARLDLSIVYVLSSPPEGWEGEKGYVNAELFKRHLPAPFDAHEYFICGPNVMMDAIEKTLGDLGVPISKYHSERYAFV